jgi:hypothetical protein
VRRVVVPGVAGGVGALALDLAWGQVSTRFTFIPTAMQTGWGALLAKLGLVWGLSAVAVRFLPARMKMAAHNAGVGAATVLFYTSIKGMAQSVLPAGTPGLSGYMDYQSFALPSRGLSGYMRPQLGSLNDMYSPAAVIQPPGVPVPQQFAGYMQPHVMGSGGLMGFDWANDGM